MPVRKQMNLMEQEALPNLQHGVPGMEIHHDDGKGGKRPRKMRPAPLSDRNESYVLYIALIFGIALVLRILVVLMGPMSEIEQAHVESTAIEMQLADNLKEHKAFALDAQPEGSVFANLESLRAERGELAPVDDAGLRADVYHAPGYPTVLAIYKFAGQPMVWLLFLQCLIGAALVPLTFALGRGLLNRKLPAAIASAVVAVHPAMLIAPSVLAGDVFVCALVVLGLWAITDAERRSFRTAAGGGIAIGAAALFTPMMVWLAPLAATWLVLTERRMHAVALAVVLMLGTAIPVGGWAYRDAGPGSTDRITAGPAIDKWFGTVAAMQMLDEEAVPFEVRNNQLAQLRQSADAEAAKDLSLFAVMDELANERIKRDRAALAEVAGETSLRLAVDHSLARAYSVLGIEYIAGGMAEQKLGRIDPAITTADPTTGYIIDGWVALNALLLVATALGAVIMLWRRHFAALAICVLAIGLFAWMATAGPSETLRLPLMAIQALMVTAMFAPAPRRAPKVKKRKLRKLEKIDAANAKPRSANDSVRDAPHPALAMAEAAQKAERDMAAQKLAELENGEGTKDSDEDDDKSPDVFDEESVPVAAGRPI